MEKGRQRTTKSVCVLYAKNVVIEIRTNASVDFESLLFVKLLEFCVTIKTNLADESHKNKTFCTFLFLFVSARPPTCLLKLLAFWFFFFVSRSRRRCHYGNLKLELDVQCGTILNYCFIFVRRLHCLFAIANKYVSSTHREICCKQYTQRHSHRQTAVVI